MKTNFSMLFYLKKQYTSGTAPIYLRITVDGQRAEVTANRDCEPVRWTSHAGSAIGTKENTRSLNAYLDNPLSEAYEVHELIKVSLGHNFSNHLIKDLKKFG
ncbi:MAG: Arm DNA-binding domain-containing protein [Ferruginibacter sp.]